MTDYQHETPHDTAPIFAADELGDAPARPRLLFQPDTGTSARTADEALLRLADEIADFAQRDEAAHERLADMANADPEHERLSAEATCLEGEVKGRLIMAALVRADTLAGLAEKGRAALAFRKTLEGCMVDETAPFLISMAEDAVRLAGQAPDQLWASQDADVIHAAAEVRRLSIANDAIWGGSPELDDEHPEQLAWKVKADEASERFREAVAHLATLQPVTPVGMAAKAAAASALTSFWDFVDCGWHEADLMQSIAADAQRIGAAMPAPTHAGRAALVATYSDDASLIRCAQSVAMLARRLRANDAEHEARYARYLAEAPAEPDNIKPKAREAYMAILAAYDADPSPKNEQRASDALRRAAGARQLLLDAYAAEMRAWELEIDAIERAIGLDATYDDQNRLHELLLQSAEHLTLMPPTTLAGLTAKAEASIEISRGKLEAEPWARDLSAMVVRETLLIPVLAVHVYREPVSPDQREAA